MSGKPIKIPVDVETGSSESNLEQVADGFDDIGKSVDKTADATQDLDRALDKVGGSSGFEQVADDAKDAAKKIDRDLTRALDDAVDASKKTGRKIGDDLGDGAKRASEGMDEIKDSARQNAIETAASFDGSADSIADGFQGAAAEAFVGFGPAAAAAGIAATLGLGLLRSKMEEAKEQAQETAEQIAEIAGQLIDLGDLKLSDTDVIDALREAAGTAEDGKVRLQEWAAAATDAGVSFTEYARGMAGDSESLRRAYDEVNSKLKEYQDGLLNGGIKAYGDSSTAVSAYTAANYDQVQSLEAAKKALEEKDFTLDEGSKVAQLYTDATTGLAEADEVATAATEEHQRAVEGLQSALEAAADPVKVYDELMAEKQEAERAAAEATADATKSSTDSWEDYAKSTKVSVNDLIKEWNAQAKEAEAFTDNLATIAANGGQALADELRAKGPEVAGAVAETIANADPKKQKEAIEAHAGALGDAVTKEMSDAIDSPAGKLLIQTAVNTTLASLGVPTIPIAVDPAHLTNSINNALRNQYFTLNTVPRVGSPRPV